MTKKEMARIAQNEMNNYMEKYVVTGLEVWNNNNHGKGTRLNSMNAKVYKIGDIHYLVSYETLVAFVINGKGFDIMRMNEFRKVTKRYYFGGYYEEEEYTNYSRSSARQISKFFDLFGVESVYTYRPL